MKHLSPHIKDLPLTDIAIPGSHDAMTFDVNGYSGFGPDTEEWQKILLDRFPFNAHVNEYWARTQSLNTTQQLLSGIRYLDLRLATKPNERSLYFVHTLYAGEITKPLQEVKKFVDTHPGEVVILHFQHFYGLKPEDHTRLIEFLQDLYGSRLVPRPYTVKEVTLNDLVRRKQSIIIVYNHYAGIMFPKLWYPSMLRSPWPDKRSTSELMQYFYELNRTSGVLFVHQAVLTPNLSFILLNLRSSLLEACAKPILRDIVPVLGNEFVTGKVGKKKPAPVNIVIADFVDLEDNRFAKTIIALNEKLYPRPNSYY